jgi:hypothetical protein
VGSLSSQWPGHHREQQPTCLRLRPGRNGQRKRLAGAQGQGRLPDPCAQHRGGAAGAADAPFSTAVSRPALPTRFRPWRPAARLSPLQQAQHGDQPAGLCPGVELFRRLRFVALLQIRETAVFLALAIGERQHELKSGLAVLNLSSSTVDGLLWCHSCIEEVFPLPCFPGGATRR